MTNEILVIDDDLGEFKSGLQQALKGCRLHLAYSGREAFDILQKSPGISLALLDIKMPPDFAEVEGREGIEVLKRLKAERPDLPVIMLTVLTDVDLVVEAIQAGAFYYITKPIDRDKLRDTVKRAFENVELRQRLAALSRSRDAVLTVHGGRPGKARNRFHGMIGAHPLMQQIYDQIERAAQFEDMNIVILGESGSGKDLAAQAIHACSPRCKGPFLAVNCAALPESMLEGELFGHEKGAFTGADAKRDGLFVLANGGTLFLDEIGDMSPALQSKVLRAIENKEVTPIAGTPITVNVRIVCATHRDLTESKNAGKFREDLYYRVWDIPLALPPLRQRKDDVPPLVKHFLDECAERNRIQCSIDRDGVEALAEYDWPGNVRELASVVRRLAVFAENGRITESQVRECLRLPPRSLISPPEALPDAHCASGEAVPQTEQVPQQSPEPIGEEPAPEELPEIADLSEFRRIHGEIRLKEVLERALKEGGNARAAMALIGMPEDRYDVFRKWLQRLGISVRLLT